MAQVVNIDPTFQHVLDQDTTLRDLLVDDELLVIGSDEENHGELESAIGRRGDGEMMEVLQKAGCERRCGAIESRQSLI